MLWVVLITTKLGVQLSDVSVIRCDVEDLTYRLLQVGERAARGMTGMMRDEAEAIVEKAKSNAPIDKGNLEQAIKLDESRSRGLSGQFGRTVFTIYVDGNVVDNDGKPVSEYATIMHEELAPYGSGNYDLGKKSQSKMMEGHDVGGKYLERAVEERRYAIKEKARQIAAKATRS